MNDATEKTLLARAVAAMQGLGIRAIERPLPQAKGKRAADARLQIARGNERTDYLVEIKRVVTPATLGAAVVQLKDLAGEEHRPTLLVAHYLTPPVAEALRALRQPFADGAGNLYLDTPAMFIYVVGRRPLDMKPPDDGKAFTTNGLKIMFTFICQPALTAAPHRAIAEAAGVALGAVPAVLADLQARGQVLIAGRNRHLNATKRLLDEWALAYARKLRPKTRFATYRTENFDKWQRWKLDPGVRWGGEPAAQLLVRHLRPGILTLYADKVPARLVIEQRMVGAEPIEPYVEVRRPFWGNLPLDNGGVTTVPPPLIYADLLATGDGRCLETAQMIYDGHLAGSFPTA